MGLLASVNTVQSTSASGHGKFGLEEKLEVGLRMGRMTNKLGNRENCCPDSGPGRQLHSIEINISSESVMRAVSRLPSASQQEQSTGESHYRLVWSNRQGPHSRAGGRQLGQAGLQNC